MGAWLLLFAPGGGARRGGGGAPPPPPPAGGRTPVPDLPPGVAARVRGQDVTVEQFRLHLARRMSLELADESSPTTTVLKFMTEQRVVEAEAARLGLSVSDAEVTARYDQLDDQVRRLRNGTQTLADVMKMQRTSLEQFRLDLRLQILKDRVASHPSYLGAKLPKDDAARLAQIEVVMGQILARAKIDRTGLPPGVVARVDGRAITEAEFGSALAMRLPEEDVRTVLVEHCAALLLEGLVREEGITVTDADIEAAVEIERARWNRTRTEDARPELQSLSYEDRVQMRYRRPLAELMKDPFFRGYLALQMRFRRTVTDEDVVKQYKAEEGRYGARIDVTDVVVSFKLSNAVAETTRRRTEAEADRLVADYVRRLKAGDPADAILAEIRGKREPGIVAKRGRLRWLGNEMPIFEQAAKLKDGEWSAPFKTLSEVHLLRRESATDAPPYAAVRDEIREDVVFLRAEKWLREQMETAVTFAKR